MQSKKVAYLLVMGLHGIQVSLEITEGILAGVQLLLHACQLGLQSCLPGAFTGMCLYRLHAGMSHLDRYNLSQPANPLCLRLRTSQKQAAAKPCDQSLIHASKSSDSKSCRAASVPARRDWTPSDSSRQWSRC